jgi:hypothetical protein
MGVDWTYAFVLRDEWKGPAQGLEAEACNGTSVGGQFRMEGPKFGLAARKDTRALSRKGKSPCPHLLVYEISFDPLTPILRRPGENLISTSD